MSQFLRRALPALVLLQGSLLSAQTIHEFGGQQVSTPWPVGQVSFGRSVSGRLTANAIPDGAVLVGTTATVLLDADPRDARLQLGFTASDIDVLPGGGWDGLDALVSVGPEGLRLTRFEASSGVFVSTLIDAQTWAGARLVRAIDIDGDGAADLVGLADDGLTLVSLLAGSTSGQFSAGPQAVGSAPVRDLIGVQWDADAALELALLTDERVEVLEADGTLRDEWQAILPGGALARITQVGQPTDRLTWITAYAPPAQQLLMTLAPGGGVQDSVVLGALDAFSAQGGDYDLDGDDDLLVSHHYSNELIWFENLRSPQAPLAASFQAQDQELTLFRVGPPGQNALLNQANPISADLDGDGDIDVLFACQTSQSLELLRGETVDQIALASQLLGATWKPEAAAPQGLLACELAQPQNLATEATHLQVIVWRRADLAAPLASQPCHAQLLALPASWPLQLDLPLPENTPEFAALYELELRQVRVADGVIERAYPSSVDVFATGETNVTAIGNLPGGGGELIVPTETEIPSTSSTAKAIRRPKTSGFGSGGIPYI